MILAGGYPILHNKANISTMYTFVNGQKKYIFKDNNITENIRIKDWNAGNNIFHMPTLTAQQESSYDLAMISPIYPYSKVSFSPMYDNNKIIMSLASRRWNICVGSYTTYTDELPPGGFTGIYSGLSQGWPEYTKYCYIYNPLTDTRVIPFENVNWLFYEICNSRIYQTTNPYNGNSEWSNGYDVKFMDDGIYIDKLVDTNYYKRYFIDYNNMSTVIDADMEYTGLLHTTFKKSLFYGMSVFADTNLTKLYFFDKGQYKYSYNFPTDETGQARGGYITFCGRYCYKATPSKLICMDLLTGEKAYYDGISSQATGSFMKEIPINIAGSSFITASNPFNGGYIIRWNKLEEPIIKSNPFNSGSSYAQDSKMFSDGTYRYYNLSSSSSDSKYYINSIDYNNNIITNLTNLTYTDTYNRIVSQEKKYIIVKVRTGSTSPYTYSFKISWNDGITFEDIQ